MIYVGIWWFFKYLTMSRKTENLVSTVCFCLLSWKEYNSLIFYEKKSIYTKQKIQSESCLFKLTKKDLHVFVQCLDIWRKCFVMHAFMFGKIEAKHLNRWSLEKPWNKHNDEHLLSEFLRKFHLMMPTFSSSFKTQRSGKMIENDEHMIMWFQEFYFFLISLIEKFIDSLRTLSVSMITWRIIGWGFIQFMPSGVVRNLQWVPQDTGSEVPEETVLEKASRWRVNREWLAAVDSSLQTSMG